MTNFDFLKKDAYFSSFSSVAVSSEHLLHIDQSSCVINCRRAMEFAIKWMYENDEYLENAKGDNLIELMGEREFKDIVGDDILQRMHYIRKLGNSAAHDERKISKEQASLCLENLFVFLDFVAYCYSENYTQTTFDKSLLEFTAEEALSFVTQDKTNNNTSAGENKAAKHLLSDRRKNHLNQYVPNHIDKNDENVRQMYIEAMLEEAGWKQNKGYKQNVRLPSKKGKNKEDYADYILYRADARPIAVIETKFSSTSIEGGRKRAQNQIKLLQNKYHCKVFAFLTDGFNCVFLHSNGSQKSCDGIYSRNELESM